MRELQTLRIDDKIHDTLLLMEHPEIVTVGPRARNDGITAPPDYPTFPVDRGGGLIWHGRVQIVCYPIFKWDLPDEDSVTAIIAKLEDWVIESLTTLRFQHAKTIGCKVYGLVETKFVALDYPF